MSAARVALLAMATLGAGCAGKYLTGPIEGAAAQPRDQGCDFVVTDVIPRRPFDTLAVLAPEDIESTSLPITVVAAQKAVAKEVCLAGGDAVVMERDAEARFVRATIIKLK
jgi:hypothetical protein